MKSLYLKRQIGLFLIILALIISSCEDKDEIFPNIEYNGETLFVYHSGHFLIWNDINEDVIVGNGAESETDGQLNTTAIVEQLGNGDYAASFCDS